MTNSHSLLRLVFYGDGIITLLTPNNIQQQISLAEAFKNIKDFSQYKILTPLGYKEFDYISKKTTSAFYQLTFKHIKTNEITCLNLTR